MLLHAVIPHKQSPQSRNDCGLQREPQGPHMLRRVYHGYQNHQSCCSFFNAYRARFCLALYTFFTVFLFTMKKGARRRSPNIPTAIHTHGMPPPAAAFIVNGISKKSSTSTLYKVRIRSTYSPSGNSATSANRVTSTPSVWMTTLSFLL